MYSHVLRDYQSFGTYGYAQPMTKSFVLISINIGTFALFRSNPSSFMSLKAECTL